MEQQQSQVVEKQIKKLIEIPLSEAAAAKLGMEAGSLAGERDTSKQQAKAAEEKLKEVLKQLERGSISEEKIVTMKLDYASHQVSYFDGERLIEERAMLEGEYQIDMEDVKHGVVENAEPTLQEELNLN